jgi:septum formation protein
MQIDKIILGSKSPRRQELVKHLGYPVEIQVQDIDEHYPDTLKKQDIPEYLAILKAEPLKSNLKEDEVLLTSDTIVLLRGEVLGKPVDADDAIRMLKKLSGNTHEVISGVALTSIDKQHTFKHITKVTFRSLSLEEITSYVKQYQPMDKAGAYGIQEWIGYIGVTRIEGSYLNVVGLPLADVLEELKRF